MQLAQIILEVFAQPRVSRERSRGVLEVLGGGLNPRAGVPARRRLVGGGIDETCGFSRRLDRLSVLL